MSDVFAAVQAIRVRAQLVRSAPAQKLLGDNQKVTTVVKTSNPFSIREEKKEVKLVKSDESVMKALDNAVHALYSRCFGKMMRTADRNKIKLKSALKDSSEEETSSEGEEE